MSSYDDTTHGHVVAYPMSSLNVPRDVEAEPNKALWHQFGALS